MAVVNRMGWTMFRIWRASKQKKLETVRKSPNMVAFIHQTMGIYPGYTQFASVFIVFAMLYLALLTTVTGPGDQPWWMGMYCNTQTWYVGLSNVFYREKWCCGCFIFATGKTCDFLRKALIPPMTSLKAIWQSCPFRPTSVQTWQMPDDLSVFFIDMRRNLYEATWKKPNNKKQTAPSR